MKKILIPIGLFIALIIGVIMSFSRGSAESPTFMREVLPKQDGFASDDTGKYAYAYSLGVGKNSQIYAENNVANIAGKDYTSFVKVFGGKQLTAVNKHV